MRPENPLERYTKSMIEAEIVGGVVHDLPDDLRGALIAEADLVDLWEILTPLVRNE